MPNRSIERLVTSLRIVIAAVVVLVVGSAVVGSGSACSKEPKPFVSLLRVVPEQCTHLTYWATGDLNADEDLWNIYSRFKDGADARQLKECIQVLASVEESARIVSSDNAATIKAPVTVLRGSFDTKHIKGQFEMLGYSQTVYRDVGIWTAEENQTACKSLSLQSGTILMGDVLDLKACIDVAKRKAQSLQDDPNIRLVANRLPTGVIMEIDKANASSTEKYADLVAYGKSYTKAKKDMLKVTAVYMFGDGPAAGAALQQIKDYLLAGFKEVKVERQDNLVIAIGEIPVGGFAQTVTF